MRSPLDRYNNDPSFHALVDSMTAEIYRAKFTPSEMREAAVLASIHYEMHHVRQHFRVVPMKVNEAMSTLTDWRKKQDDPNSE